MKRKYDVTGMTCAACSLGIEKTVKKLNGVKNAEVSLMGESMSVEFDEKVLKEEQIFSAVLSLGYGIYKEGEYNKKEKKDESKTLKKRFIISLILLLPLMYLSMGGMLSLPQPPIEISLIAQFIITLSIIIINFKFFTVGVKAVFKGVPNMDTLVTLGSTASFCYSVYVSAVYFLDGVMIAEHVFYESAAMILTLVTLGKWLESNSKKKTGKEIEKLIKMMPETATLLVRGEPVTVPVSELKEGDLLLIRAGDYICVDGIITEGHGFIDASAITGESVPVETGKYGDVKSGSILKNGTLVIKAQSVGRDTTISKIIKMVQEAAASKAPIQKLADTVAGIFVPLVLLIAIITFGVWYFLTRDINISLNYAIDVLVISCPCALGLATPVAIMAATGKGASLGIFYKSAEALEKTRSVNCVLFDKTGTLTKGEIQVSDFECFADENIVRGVAGGMEALSNHPLAECIAKFCAIKYPVSSFEYVVGKGAKAKYAGVNYKLGSRSFCVGSKNIEKCDKYLASGKSVVCLERNNEIIGIFAVADAVKEDSPKAVSSLKKQGIKTAMITGDSKSVAKSIAEQVGIDDYYAEVMPKDKLACVKNAQSFGGVVAMVGDGINDSPALMQADVGIAMGDGTDVAIDSADIVLVGGNINKISTAITLSKATMRVIKQNLFWAFFYNCIGIPVAAGALSVFNITLTPMIAAACMCVSSLFVVTNALRLTKFKEDKKEEVSKMNKKTLKVEGMMCKHCVARVEKALSSVDGVLKVEVNLKKKTASVEFDGEIADEALINAVVEAGYEVKEIK